jgi:hypothetical protein
MKLRPIQGNAIIKVSGARTGKKASGARKLMRYSIFPSKSVTISLGNSAGFSKILLNVDDIGEVELLNVSFVFRAIIMNKIVITAAITMHIRAFLRF